MRPLVLPLTWGYAAVTLTRRFAYDHGWLRSRKALDHSRVVAIGGLEAGGTGKTPTAGYVLSVLRDLGCSVGLVSRGFGRASHGMILRRPGEACTPQLLGDEPAMLVASGHDVAVCVCAKRAQGVQALAALGIAFCVLDDAFAHRRCPRDLDIVTLCGEAPFGNGHLLPWGNLREPVSSLHRADVLWLNFRTEIDPKPCVAELQARFPDKLVVAAQLKQAAPVDWQGHVQTLLGTPIVLAAGIARPEIFYEQVSRAGAEIRDFKVFPDHHAFDPAEIHALAQCAKARRAEAIVVTAKDAIKFNSLVKLPNLWVVDTHMHLVHGKEALKKMLGNLRIS